MSTPLSRLAPELRRHIAATLGLFSVLFIAVGAVAATGDRTGVVMTFVIVAFVIALLLALIAWGVLQSIRIDQAATDAVRSDRRIDAAIEEALADQGGSISALTCGCGHDHDPDELHVTDDPCSRDGAGHECSQTCDTCVFSRLSSVPASAALDGGARQATSTGSRRPSPRPAARRPVPGRALTRD